MVSYAESYPVQMHSHEFESYPDYLQPNQAYMTPFMDGGYTTSFEPQPSVQALSNVPRPQDYPFAFDASAKAGYQQHYSPTASPHSGSGTFDNQPPQLSTSSESGASVSPSAMGSPSLNAPQFPEASWAPLESQGLGMKDAFHPDQFTTSGFGYDNLVSTSACVDPTLIEPFPSPLQYPASPAPFTDIRTPPHFPFVEQPPSPAPSNHSHASHLDSRRFKQGSQSPFLSASAHGFQPYPNYPPSRRSSIQSRHSNRSGRSGSFELDEETVQKGLCPIPECGRVFKDLKAHMLTHQNERPEKCPIVTCEYHLKGFARKYDKNRHTLTHYKGTMVCGFCPGSGSAAEKSFNRADVFKRHLTSVHGVEQTPPNSRKKSPTATKKNFSPVQQNAAGTCSTCSVTFANAQEFYEHLDDCVLRVVQQADPSEAINQKLLSSVAEDKNVKETMDRHCLSNDLAYAAPNYDEIDEEDEDEVENDDDNDGTYGSKSGRAGKGAIKPKKGSSA